MFSVCLFFCFFFDDDKTLETALIRKIEKHECARLQGKWMNSSVIWPTSSSSMTYCYNKTANLENLCQSIGHRDVSTHLPNKCFLPMSVSCPVIPLSEFSCQVVSHDQVTIMLLWCKVNKVGPALCSWWWNHAKAHRSHIEVTPPHSPPLSSTLDWRGQVKPVSLGKILILSQYFIIFRCQTGNLPRPLQIKHEFRVNQHGGRGISDGDILWIISYWEKMKKRCLWFPSAFWCTMAVVLDSPSCFLHLANITNAA